MAEHKEPTSDRRPTSDGDQLIFRWETLVRRLPALEPQAQLTREKPTDFKVFEIPAYPPSGSGEHVMLEVEKTGLSTLEVARRLAQRCACDSREVGFAGRKDVHAVAVQWFTVPRRRNVRLEGEVSPGIRVLRSALHRNKLQLGHLHGNRFEVLLRRPREGALQQMRDRVPQVEQGVPNYFGPQRFGHDGRNALDGLRVLSGERRGGDPRGLQMLVSAVQSMVFNRVVDFRVRMDPEVMPVAGDILVKLPTGAPFWCDRPEEDIPRVREGKVAVTGPLPGARMRRPRGEVMTWESRILGQVIPQPTWLMEGRRAPLGDRRPILLHPRELRVEAHPEGLLTSLILPPGAYATSVFREWAGITEDGHGAPGAAEEG